MNKMNTIQKSLDRLENIYLDLKLQNINKDTLKILENAIESLELDLREVYTDGGE